MAYSDREKKIIDLLRGRQSVGNREIASRLYVSPATLRRDLAKMEEKGLILRMHGAAALNYSRFSEAFPFDLQTALNAFSRKEIANKAAAFLRHGDVIMMDGSPAVSALVPVLSRFKDVIAITNGVKTAYQLGLLGIQCISTGGRLRTDSMTLTGGEALDTLNRYEADLCLVGCSGVTEDGLIYESSEAEAEMKQEMIRRSGKRVLVLKGNCVPHPSWTCFSDLRQFDGLLSEEAVPEKFSALLRSPSGSRRTF